MQNLLHVVVQRAEYHVLNIVAVEMRDVEITGTWCVTMMTIMTAIMMTQMMKIMNSFILIFYLKVAICIQRVLYLVVLKSISWNLDDLKLNFLLWKSFKNKVLPDLSKAVKKFPFRIIFYIKFRLKWYIICLFPEKKHFSQNFVSAKMPQNLNFA